MASYTLDRILVEKFTVDSVPYMIDRFGRESGLQILFIAAKEWVVLAENWRGKPITYKTRAVAFERAF